MAYTKQENQTPKASLLGPILLSALTPTMLGKKLRNLLLRLEEPTIPCEQTIKQNHLSATEQYKYRIAILATSQEELISHVREALCQIRLQSQKQISKQSGIYYNAGASTSPVAFVFPGQGSQYLGMTEMLSRTWQPALAAWKQAAKLRFTGEKKSINEIVFPDSHGSKQTPEEHLKQLTDTQWAQPAIGTASLAYLNLLQCLGIQADAVGGHSYGELTALYAAKAIDSDTLLKLARRRGELMRDAAKIPGAMTAVRSPAKKVEEILLAHHVKVRLANDNAPNQVVLSGTVDTIEQAEAVLEAQGLRIQRLPVATAFHSSVVESAEKPFLDTLTREDICTPNIPVYANTTGLPYPDGPGSIRKTLSSQITNTVRFVEQIDNMYQAGIRTFVEVGPGTVLSGLIRRILKGKEHTCISLNSKKTSDVTAFIHAIGRMWTLGIPMNIQNLWAEQFSAEAPRTELTVHRTEPSLAKVA